MPAAQTSTITDPGEFVTRFIENIEQFHFSDAMAMVADDCEYDNVPITKVDRKSTRLNSSHVSESRMPSSA